MTYETTKLFPETSELIDQLTDADAGKLIKAIVHYAATGDDPDELPITLKLVWPFVRHSVDNYNNSTERNAENGRKGGRPRKNPETRLKTENPSVLTEETEEKPVGFDSKTEKNPPVLTSETEKKPVTLRTVTYRDVPSHDVSSRDVSSDDVVVGARASEEAEHEDEMPVYPDFNPDNGWDRFMREYEQNLGVFPMAQRAIDEVQADYDDLGVDVMCEAIRQTALANPANPFQYFRGVLAKWRQKGYTTLQQVQADAIDHQRQKAQVARSGTSAAKPNPALQYEQRTYTDDDFSDMFVDLSNPESESCKRAMGLA